MGYSKNVLKTEAAYYELSSATITGGKLSIRAGGYARQPVTEDDLSILTDTMLFRCIVDNQSEQYIPRVFIDIHAISVDTEEVYNTQIFPVYIGSGAFQCIFSMFSGAYSEMTVTLHSDISTTFTIWELCPEAADEDVELLIDGVKQSLPRLLYDYNTFPLVVDQAETVVAVIACRLIQDTDLQGHFAITFQASEVTTVVVRFYDNEGEELFAPMYYDCNVGHNTIGIPHSYLKRKSGPHSFVVTMQAYAGVLSIGTRDILFTIDGGYLAARELELAMDIMDLSVMQLESSAKPDEIWVIGRDKGKLLVRKRAYEEDNANVGWAAVADMGQGKHAAIEFDGRWALRDKDEKFTIYTEEEPFMFLVSEEGVLTAHHGTQDENPTELDTSVKMVKACKGFSSEKYVEQDQGLVVSYLKEDGTAWYRQYVWNTQLEKKTWLEAVQIGTETWDHINVSRLNDYRLSFQLVREDKVLWLYTDQTWVGQASPPEITDLNVYNVPKELWVDSITAVRDLYISEVVLTSKKEGDTRYLWTVSFVFSRPIISRMPFDIVSKVTLTNDLNSKKQSVSWNEKLNAIDVVILMDTSPEEASIVRGTFTYSSTDAELVVEYDGGWATVGTVSYDWLLDNSRKIEYQSSEQISFLEVVVSGQLVFLTKKYPSYLSRGDATSLIPMNYTGQLEWNQKNYVSTQQPKDSTSLSLVSFSSTIGYEGTNVKPI